MTHHTVVYYSCKCTAVRNHMTVAVGLTWSWLVRSLEPTSFKSVRQRYRYSCALARGLAHGTNYLHTIALNTEASQCLHMRAFGKERSIAEPEARADGTAGTRAEGADSDPV